MRGAFYLTDLLDMALVKAWFASEFGVLSCFDSVLLFHQEELQLCGRNTGLGAV